ncbi:MAG: DUF5930 domain-containing protein [Pseudomonadota bacterium]
MLRRLSDRINGRLDGLFPERRLILRSERSTQYMRLTPFAQAAAFAALIGFGGWTAYASLALADASLRAGAADQRLAETRAGFETRVARLTERAASLEADLALSEDQRAYALAQLESQHDTLSNAVAAERELAAALQTHRRKFDRLAGEHDATVQVCEATANQVTALEVKLLDLTRQNETLSDTLAALNHTLGDVATERDEASELKQTLALQLDELSAEIAQQGERRRRMFAQLEDAAAMSLGALEGVFERTGLEIEPLLSAVREEYDGEGGPFMAEAEVAAIATQGEDEARLARLMEELERVNLMRLVAEKMPLYAPTRGARFTSGFGTRRDPFNGRRAIHSGMDFAAPRGTPIYAAGRGVVTEAGRQRGYGKIIKIRHAFGYESVYAHLDKIRVKVGETVERGARIGDMGNTGRSTGSHLHYEIRRDGVAINPSRFIEAARNVL